MRRYSAPVPFIFLMLLDSFFIHHFLRNRGRKTRKLQLIRPYRNIPVRTCKESCLTKARKFKESNFCIGNTFSWWTWAYKQVKSTKVHLQGSKQCCNYCLTRCTADVTFNPTPCLGFVVKLLKFYFHETFRDVFLRNKTYINI